MNTLTVKWTGVRPTLMHNGQTADPTNRYAIEMKKYTSMKKKTPDVYEKLKRLEWEAGFYWDSVAGPYWPSDNIERCIQSGAAKSRRGKDVQAAVLVQEDVVKLDYKGPRTLEKLWEQPEFQLSKLVVVNRARVVRCRPRFPVGWSVTFTVEYDPEIISKSDLMTAMQDAGSLIGLSDWRPKYGRFTVEEVK